MVHLVASKHSVKYFQYQTEIVAAIQKIRKNLNQ